MSYDVRKQQTFFFTIGLKKRWYRPRCSLSLYMLPNLSCFNGKYESESNINKKVFFLKKNGDLTPANKLMNYLVQFGFSFYFFSFAVFFFSFFFFHLACLILIVRKSIDVNFDKDVIFCPKLSMWCKLLNEKKMPWEKKFKKNLYLLVNMTS